MQISHYRIVASGMDQKLEMFSVTAGEKLYTFSNFGKGNLIATSNDLSNFVGISS